MVSIEQWYVCVCVCVCVRDELIIYECNSSFEPCTVLKNSHASNGSMCTMAVLILHKVVKIIYCRSGNFHVKKLLYDKFLCKKIL